ncbi:LysR substrate-binding domain-containing protein [Micropruina glycogenica]|nr:LysR substrate-binding domain-containing protein [Micropruina glycogenica]
MSGRCDGEQTAGYLRPHTRCAALADVPLMLPRPVHTNHATVQRALQAAGVQPTVAAELGVTMLPRSVAERLAADSNLRLVRVTDPIEVHLSLGTPSSLPLSRAAECVRDVLRQVVAVTLSHPSVDLP